MKDNMKKLSNFAKLFASPKRLILLKLICDGPSYYTKIFNDFKSFIGIPIGSSEVYKHLKMLIDYEYISKQGNTYVPTSKGIKAINKIEEIINEKPKVPKVKIEF